MLRICFSEYNDLSDAKEVQWTPYIILINLTLDEDDYDKWNKDQVVTYHH